MLYLDDCVDAHQRMILKRFSGLWLPQAHRKVRGDRSNEDTCFF